MDISSEIIQAKSSKPSCNVLDPIKKRFSPRVFNAYQIPDSDLSSIFEAARLAPSAMNQQPWNYLWMRNGSTSFAKLLSCIPDFNQWAKTASVLIISTYDPFGAEGKDNRWAEYDLGSANMSLILQAQALGYYCRQIGSFDVELVNTTFLGVKHGFRPFVLLALGKIGNATDYLKAEADVVNRERHGWERKEQIATELK